MDIDEQAGKLEVRKWNPEHTAFTATCPLNSAHVLAVSKAKTKCLGGCADALIAAFFKNGKGGDANNLGPKSSPEKPDNERPAAVTNVGGPRSNGSAKAAPAHPLTSQEIQTRPSELDQWRTHVWITMQGIQRDDPAFFRQAPTDVILAIASQTDTIPYLRPPADLSRTDAEEEIDKLVGMFIESEVPKQVALHTVAPPLAIPWEGFDQAVLANEEYLKRIPVIDKLCYSSAVSMITGGKHAGKSTLARWMAICVAKGYEFLKRSVVQGPVLYIASEDETMAARQELIRLGWKQGDGLKFLSASRITIDDQREFLRRLTKEIIDLGAVLVMIDMLFDFVPISDEMSYAGTREAVGLIQEVASQSSAHIVAIHHAPKNAMIGDAAVAALGSQGLAARVSPIILVRRFGPGVHSISSTSVRDPRGEPVTESKLVRNEDGSVELGGGWKNYMLAEVYMERVKEMLDEDPGAEMSAPEIAEALTISYQVARGCLAALFRNGMVNRTGSGKKGKPFHYASLLSPANNPSEILNTVHTPIPVGETESKNEGANQGVQQPFAYKD